MTGKDLVSLWWATILSQEDIGRTELMNLAANIDAALAAERERCAQVVWECRGHCVTDDAARDLMEQVQRTP